MSKPKLTLFIDIRSGYSYLTFTVTRNSSVFANCDVTYVPVDLRAIWKECGIQPSWGLKNKPDWIVKSAGLWARKFEIPMNGPPPGFLENSTTLLQQTLCAVSIVCPERLADVIAILEETFWVQQKPLFLEEDFRPVFKQALGVKLGQDVVVKGQTLQMQDLLVANTQLCIKEGAFGLPWILTTNVAGEKDTFFGFDHLGHAVDFLGLEKPTPGSLTEKGWSVMM